MNSAAKLNELLANLNFENVLDLIPGLLSSSWFNELAPGADRLAGCSQGTIKHFEGDVAVHTALVVKNIFLVCQQREKRVPTKIELLAAILHDLRKPDCRHEEEGGRVSFLGHEVLAATDIPAIAARIGLDQRDTAALMYMVAYHGIVYAWKTMAPEDQKELQKSPSFRSLLLLVEADCLSCILADGSAVPPPFNYEELTSNA